jgi:hypothetical protein
MELSKDDIDLLKKFFDENDLGRVVISGHVRKGVLKIRFELIKDTKVLRSLRAFVSNGRLLLFESP